MQIRTVPLNSTPVKVIRFDPDKDTIGQLASNLRNSIFLAGPCPRKDYNNDWRNEAFKILASLGFEGQVITPTNARFQELRNKYGEEALKQQTLWEIEAMKKASALVFWVDRHIDEGFPAFTTNIEFGDWYDKEGVYVGFPDGADKNEYLKCRMDIAGIPYFTDLRDMLTAVVSRLNPHDGNKYFTSDTHFSTQRTLEYSHRPFKNIHEMDLEIISNWNKRVTMNDDVYHAGDFGDPATSADILSCLNFKKLHWVLGNHDRDEIDKIRPIVADTGRDIELVDKIILPDPEAKHIYHIMHEPDEGKKAPEYPEHVVLFGHIHGRGFAKKNGFDLASDYHRYTPLSLEDVRYFADVLKYWDHNVFSDKAWEDLCLYH